MDDLLESSPPNVTLLTAVFFALNFLAATQDIAVDGWALTMLQKHNVGYASTCNAVGQTAGYFIGNVVLLAFSSEDFCNKYIRYEPQPVGLVTLAGFLFFWGIVFLVTTSFVWWFKTEKNSYDEDVDKHGIVGMYKMLMKVFRLPAVRELVFNLLTAKVSLRSKNEVLFHHIVVFDPPLVHITPCHIHKK